MSNIKKGNKYKISFYSESTIYLVGIYTRNGSETVDNFGVFNNINSHEVVFTATNDAEKVILYIDGNGVYSTIMLKLLSFGKDITDLIVENNTDLENQLKECQKLKKM